MTLKKKTGYCKSEIILEKLHELFSYLPVCEKMCKKIRASLSTDSALPQAYYNLFG